RPGRSGDQSLDQLPFARRRVGAQLTLRLDLADLLGDAGAGVQEGEDLVVERVDAAAQLGDRVGRPCGLLGAPVAHAAGAASAAKRARRALARVPGGIARAARSSAAIASP